MSHTVHIKAKPVVVIPQAQSISHEVRNLEALKQSIAKLGLEFREGKQTFNFSGVKKSCSHSIGIPGNFTNEIGVLQRAEDSYELMWGATGQLAAILGANAQNLIQSYATQLVLQEVPFGWEATQVRMPNVDLVLEFAH